MLGTGSIFTTDDRLRNRFVGRHFESFRTWTVGRGNDIDHHSVRDIDLSIIAVICNNIFNAKHLGIQLKIQLKKFKKKNLFINNRKSKIIIKRLVVC